MHNIVIIYSMYTLYYSLLPENYISRNISNQGGICLTFDQRVEKQ